MLNLQDKNVIITGGTRGIGKSISLQIAECGARVFAIYARDRKSADELIQEAESRNLQITAIRGDIAHKETFNKTVEEIHKNCDSIDVIIHSAASGVHRNSTDITDRHIKWTFEVNFFAIHKLIMELFRKIPKNGRIIGITSSGGTHVIPQYSAIGSSKGALESLFRHYAYEFAPHGIIVNLICPGMVETEAIEAFPDSESRLTNTVQRTPTGRLTTTDEVATLVKFLCSNEAAQIVGQTIVIDGGKSLLS